MNFTHPYEFQLTEEKYEGRMKRNITNLKKERERWNIRGMEIFMKWIKNIHAYEFPARNLLMNGRKV